ncbi:hypothetical protein [Streptomyces sp. NPDC049555]|uniref:hypothetical protein n=1 Tax=Streptomyces sp. NPDC049555 TaxID=3154930 RepID=UPI00342C1F9A
MPLATTTRDPGGPRRRSVLGGAAAALLGGGATALLTGCSGSGAGSGGEDSAAAQRLKERAGQQSAALLAHYDATLAAHPALAARLRPLRAEVARHAEAFGPGPGSPSPSAGTGAPPAVPQDEKAALAALAEAERRTVDARTAALAAAPPGLARLLASVAASGAVHAYLLTGAAA